MDPDEALRQFNEARALYWAAEHGSDAETFAAMDAIESAEALIGWLKKGGHAPDWSRS